MKQVILTAIVLIILGLSVRHCQYSFNHDLIPDAVDTGKNGVFEWRINLPAGGHYTVEPGGTNELQQIWMLDAHDVTPERTKHIAKRMLGAGFPVYYLEDESFGVYRKLELDTLARAIHRIDSGSGELVSRD